MNPQRSAPFFRALGAVVIGGLVFGTVAVPAAQAKTKNPPKPKSVSAKATATTVTLKWKSGKGSTTGFNVYKSTKSKVSLSKHVNSKKIKGTSYKISKLSPNKSYWFVVQSVGSKSSRHSQAKTIKVTTLPTAPGAPTLTATTSPAQVKLSWKTKGGTASSFSVYRTTAATGSPVSTVNLRTSRVAASARSYTDPYVVNGRTYRYAVVAVNKGGKGTSNTVSATPNIAKPGAPTSLTAAAGDARVDLSWAAGAGATSIRVYRSTTTSVPSTGTPLATISSGTANSYADTTAANDTTYYYRVVAVNAGGTTASAVSNSAKPTTVLPGKPTLTATAGDAKVSLAWAKTGPNDVTGWNVYRSTTTPVALTAGNLLPAGTNLSASTVSLDDTTVVNKSTYYYVVTATNAFTSGVGVKSDEKIANPVVAPPAIPTINATANDHAVDLTWSAGVGGGAVATWKLYRSTTPTVNTSDAPITTVTAPAATTFRDAGLTNGQTYYYAVIAINDTDDATSTTVSATPAPGTPSDLIYTNPSALAGGSSYVMSRFGYTTITNSVIQAQDPDNNDTLTWFGVTDTATITIQNTGASTATITNATISSPNFELVGSAPTSIAAGATANITVRFVYVGASATVDRSANLNVSASGMSDLVIPLVGMWQAGPNCSPSGASCGSQGVQQYEPNLFQIVNDAFGWDTFPGYGLMDNNGTRMSGDEVKGETWQRADTSQPFKVQRLASYSSSNYGRINWYKPDDQFGATRCANTTQSQAQADCHQIAAAGVTGVGTQANPVRSQTLLPNGTTTYSVVPDETTFAFQIAGEYSVNARNNATADINDHGCQAACGHHMRFYPVKTAGGATVPNAYIVAVDLNGVNDDFNDDVVLITNIKPAV